MDMPYRLLIGVFLLASTFSIGFSIIDTLACKEDRAAAQLAVNTLKEKGGFVVMQSPGTRKVVEFYILKDGTQLTIGNIETEDGPKGMIEAVFDSECGGNLVGILPHPVDDDGLNLTDFNRSYGYGDHRLIITHNVTGHGMSYIQVGG